MAHFARARKANVHEIKNTTNGTGREFGSVENKQIVEMAECTVVKFSSASLKANLNDVGIKSNDDSPSLIRSQRFGCYYITCHILSIVTYITDMTLSCWLASLYHAQGHETYFAITITLVILSAVVSTGFSLRWYILDQDDPSLKKPPLWKWVLRIIFLLLQVSPLLRYLDSLSYGLKSLLARRRSQREREQAFYRRMVDEDSDAALLRLFHCFLHAAPQALLQLTILILAAIQKQPSTLQVFQAWSVISCLLSVGWSLTSYHRSVRFARDDKEKVSWRGTTVQFFWHLTSGVSRVLALALLAAVYPAWMGTVCLCHWVVMCAWLALGHHQTAVCSSRCEELMFSCMLGLAYVLAFIAPRDGPTRYTYLAYYLVCFMENTGALVVWCVVGSSAQYPTLYYGAVIVQILTFLSAILFMLVYYRHFHPSGTCMSLSKSVTITAPLDRIYKEGASARPFSHTL